MSFNREYISSNFWENQVQSWSSLESWGDTNPLSFDRERSWVESPQWQSLTTQLWFTFNDTWEGGQPISFNREIIILPESWETQTSGTWATSADNWDSKQYQGFIRE